MPELPEVQTVVDDLLAAGLVGQRVTYVEARWPRMVAPLEPAEFSRRLAGRRIVSLERRAKYIIAGFDPDADPEPLSMIVHLRMTGHFELEPAAQPRDAHQHLILGLDDGRELRLHDTRKFGRAQLCADPAVVLGGLGPEPLGDELDPERFLIRLGQRRRALKPLLLDQGFIAGLGNIYTDEALWRAGLHPARSSNSLSPQEAAALLSAIRRVLLEALAHRGTSLGTGETNFASGSRGYGDNQPFLMVFRRHGLACPRCGTAIARIRYAGRGTHFCPVCQRLAP
jgi:formamidopyrimidine-DNA glycosylase